MQESARERRTRVGEDDDGAGEETGGTHAGNGAADNKGDGAGGDGAEQTAYFKDEDGCEERPLDVEHAVNDTIHGLQAGRGEEVGRSIPALFQEESVSLFCLRDSRRPAVIPYNVLCAVELAGDGTERWCDDGLVEGDEENGNAQRKECEGELERARILRLGVLVVGAVLLLCEVLHAVIHGRLLARLVLLVGCRQLGVGVFGRGPGLDLFGCRVNHGDDESGLCKERLVPTGVLSNGAAVRELIAGPFTSVDARCNRE